jgi:hypothetical protein
VTAPAARRRGVLLAGASLLLAACGLRREAPAAGPGTVASRLPRDASRFVLEARTDSTVWFLPEEARWVRPGLTGIAVDPIRGDALVARVRVTLVQGDSAIALVTGQTTRVATGQVLLLSPPPRRAWRERAFWYGAVTGASVVGLVQRVR